MVFMKNLNTFPVILFNRLLSPTRPFFNYYHTCFTYNNGRTKRTISNKSDGWNQSFLNSLLNKS